MNKVVDSFGWVVNVGDYVYFRVKTEYANAALSVGRVEKISEKGSLSLIAINTHGMTIEDYLDVCAKRAADARADVNYKPAYESWIGSMGKPFKQRLASASSTVKVHPMALTPALQQALA